MVTRITRAPGDNAGKTGSTQSELDALAQEADALGAETVPPGGAETATDTGQAPQLTNATLIAGILEFVREGFCLATKLESPRKTFTDDHATMLGQAWGLVCDKRGIDLPTLLGDWMVEGAALIATMNVLGQVRVGLAAEFAERKRQAETQQQEPAKPPGDEGQGAA